MPLNLHRNTHTRARARTGALLHTEELALANVLSLEVDLLRPDREPCHSTLSWNHINNVYTSHGV